MSKALAKPTNTTNNIVLFIKINTLLKTGILNYIITSFSMRISKIIAFKVCSIVRLATDQSLNSHPPIPYKDNRICNNIEPVLPI